MDKLKKHFLKIKKELMEKRPFFQRKMSRWNRLRRTTLYKQAKMLFDELDQCEKEIVAIFESPDWKDSRPFLKIKIKALKELLHELDLMMEAGWLKLLNAIVIVTVMVFVLRNFFFGVYHVPTSSAEHTLLVGDRVWGNKFVYLYEKPKVGDIVMFEDPLFEYEKDGFFKRFWQKHIGFELESLGLKKGPQNMAKRVIAVPGDVIEGRVEEGKAIVYRNGKKIEEPYVNTYPLLAMKKETGFFSNEKIGSFTVPDILRVRRKVVLYSYDPEKDFEEQPFYNIDYRNVLYDRQRSRMKVYDSGAPATDKEGKVIDVFGPLIVPEGKYWVMGDNRVNSVDSREWGLIDRSKISGRASFVIWSLDSEEPIWIFELIKNPLNFIPNLRFERFLKKIA